MTSAARYLATIARVFARAWWRSAALVLMMCVVAGVAVWIYARTLGPEVFEALAPSASTLAERTGVSLLTALPLLLVFALLGTVWAGAMLLISDRVGRRLPVSTLRAVRAGFARCLVALGVSIVWFAAVLLAIVATPLLVVAGIAGLIIAALTRRSGRPAWLPRTPLLWVAAVPLGAAAFVAVRLSRALPASWIDERGILESMRTSWRETRGRVWRSGAVLAVAILLVELLTELGARIASAFTTEPLWAPLAQIAIQAILGSLPIIALAVLYRSDRPSGGTPADAKVAPSPGSRTARIAGAIAAALVVQGVGLTAVVAPASALDFSTPTVTVSTAPGSGIVEGNEMAISIRVRHAVDGDDAELPTGTVTVDVNGNGAGAPLTLDEGNVSVPYPSGLPAGSYMLVVMYSGDANYSSAAGTLGFTVSSAGSVSLSVDDANLMYGDSLQATAHMSLGGAVQGGTVLFTATSSGGSLIELGTATIDSGGDAHLETTAVPPGDYTLIAVYQGDAGGPAVSSPGESFAVVAHFTEVTASLSPTSSPGAPSAPGGTVIATVSVDAIASALVPVGSIEIYPDGGGDLLAYGPLVNGEATLSMVLPPGAPVIRVGYVGGTGFYASGTTAQQYVGTWSSALGLAGAPTSTYGDAVELTATATSSVTPTGTVEFYATPDGGTATLLGTATLNASGVATFSATGLLPGDYNFTATYPGDGTAAAADATGFAHSVGLGQASVALTVNGVPTYPAVASASIAVTTTASGAGTPVGSVAIYVDGDYFGSVSLDALGEASLNLPVALPGTHEVRAVYGGSPLLATAQATQPLVVAKVTPTVVLGGAIYRSATYGDSQVYAGSVTALGMSLVPSGTVQLWADGYLVGTGTLNVTGAYSITTTTIPAIMPPANRAMVVKYLGDGSFEPAQSADAVVTEVDLADAVPVVTLGPGTVGIGGTYTLAATLPNVGAGATGTVTFHVAGGADIGPVALVGGVASTPLQVTGPNTYVTASYSGDANFTAQDSVTTHFTADRSAATVELLLNPAADPNVFVYGNTFELVARVTIAGGLDADGLVDFTTTTGAIIASDVPTTFYPSQGYGLARVTVCAGDTSGCPGGVPAIGIIGVDMIAEYPEGTLNLAATSSAVPYAMTKAPTTTTLVVNPTSIQVGSAVYLTATVANTAGGPSPMGLVSFYGVEMTPSGPAEAFIGSAPVSGGLAMVTTVAGSGIDQLRWPATQVIARFYDVGGAFASSNNVADVTLVRAGTSVAVTSGPALTGSPTTLTATISHVPGYSANYTGRVEFFIDGASSPACSPSIVGAATSVTCNVVFATGGDHSVVATYGGDVIYASSSSPATTIAVGTSVSTPNLAPVAPTNVVALTAQAVTWTPGSLTGTVTVYGGGALWCTVPVAVGTCSGNFSNDDAAASPANIVLQYSGDATHTPRQYDLGVFVTACRIVDVYSANTARGTVSLSPAPSCGTGGYPQGTAVTATAHAVAPNVFLRWRGYTAVDPGMVTVSTSPSTTFTVTKDTWSWVRAADFELPCYAISHSITGTGTMFASVQPNCTTTAGTPGYALGTTVNFQPIGLRDPVYGVPDVFYSFGTLPAGVTSGINRFGRPFVELTASADAVIPVTFGTRCVLVAVTGEPTASGDAYSVTTEANCFQPGSPGFLPTTSVSVHAQSGVAERLVGGWSTTQKDSPTLPPGAEATLAVGTDDVTLTAHWVACYPVELVIDAPTLYRKGGFAIVPKVGGAAKLNIAPNCPDGSERYLAGTSVIATPSIVVEGVIFQGWDGDSTAGNGGVVEGELTAKSKTVTVTGPTTLTASFYEEEGCSRLTVLDRQRSVTLAPDGCGEGYYADLQKARSIVYGEKQRDLWQDKFRSTITVTKKPGIVLDVYASVSGDAGTCFGSRLEKSGPPDVGGWRSLGALKDGAQECFVGGSIGLRFQQCQTVAPTVAIVREGDPEGLRYGLRDLPGYLLVPTTGGNFQPMATNDFDWVNTSPLELRNGDFVSVDQAAGACKDAGNAFEPETVLQVAADSLSQGITFVGWTSDADRDLVQSNPVLMETTETRRELPVGAIYEMRCNHVTFGEGISIEGEAPRCPGFSEEDNMFIAGAGIQIRALQHVGKRTFGDWTSGVIAATTVKDPVSGERTAIAYVNGDMHVGAKYPTEGERWANGFANAGKLIAGVAAVVAPVAVGIACPPCGIALAVVGAAGAASSLIPGGQDVANFFSLINPAKITECAAYWAFGKEEGPKGSDAGGLVKTGSGVKKIVDVIKPPPTAVEAAAAAASGATTTGKILAGLKSGGKASLQVAAVGYGLYSAGIGEADLGFETVQQLRDTSTMTNCLDEAWKFAG